MARISNEVIVKRELKFGVEIEFANDVREELKNELIRRGVRAYIQSYNHQVSNSWKIVTDSSCGYEIVSPVLNDFEELKVVCESLDKIGAKVNMNCGLHVHHDASDLDLEGLKNVYRFYNKYEKALDSIMPVSRRKDNSTWAKPIDEAWLRMVEECGSIDDMKSKLADGDPRSSKRYRKINFASYIAYGTLEFRQHSGTTNFEKISKWIMITNLILQRAEGKKVKNVSGKRLEKWNRSDLEMMYDIYKELEINGTEIANYMRNRKRKLAV